MLGFQSRQLTMASASSSSLLLSSAWFSLNPPSRNASQQSLSSRNEDHAFDPALDVELQEIDENTGRPTKHLGDGKKAGDEEAIQTIYEGVHNKIKATFRELSTRLWNGTWL